MPIPKKILVALLLFSLTLPLYSQFTYQELIFLPWGENDNQAGFRQAPGGRFGPMAFSAENDTIFLLDTQNGRLKLFKNRILLNQTRLPLQNVEDFVWNNVNDYFLLSENTVFECKIQEAVAIFSPASELNRITSLKYDGRETVYAVLNEAESIDIRKIAPPVLSKGAAGYDNLFVQIEKRGWRRFHVQIGQTDEFEILSANPDLGSVRFLGNSSSDHLFFLVEKITSQVPLQVEREVRLYSRNGTIKSIFILPNQSYTAIFREFYIAENGSLLHMVSTREGVHIVRWQYAGDKFPVGTVFKYPAKFYEDYHENRNDKPDFLHKSKNSKWEKEENLLDMADFPPVTRSEALEIGDTYVQHVWTASANNLTNGRILDPDGVEIETPDWVRIGGNSKIPYQWGGFWTLDGFDQGLLNGKFAGDRATTGVSSFCVGVDCSGFVSRCWKLPSHYSTRMMDDYITVPLSSWLDLKPGDAIHKPGHVRLFVNFNPNGSLLTVESSGRDWRVSYRSYYYSDLYEYLPRYYRFMQGMPGSIGKPELISVCFGDSVELDWQLPDTLSVKRVNVYSEQAGQLIYLGERTSVQPEQYSERFALTENEPLFFELKSVSSIDDSTESYPSDIYGYLKTDSHGKILIVDGFDRTTGSYPFPYHRFAMTMGKALAGFNYSFETACNEAVIDNSIQLENYQLVIWILGDESTKDETFSTIEQNRIKGYLQSGGKLFVSGSEVAWDLDYKGSAADKNFFHTFFKSGYISDDSESYTVLGASGTLFSGLSLHFDDGTRGVYEEDWPDALKPLNGSFVALNYANGLNAAIAFSGLVPNGTEPAKFFLLGFPFETIFNENERVDLMEKLIQFFDLKTTSVTENVTQTPQEFVLFGNYPNPFNPGTAIRYQLFKDETVRLIIYDMLGRQIVTLLDRYQKAGRYKIFWNGEDESGNPLPSGTYLYTMQTNLSKKSRKMLLLR